MSRYGNIGSIINEDYVDKTERFDRFSNKDYATYALDGSEQACLGIYESHISKAIEEKKHPFSADADIDEIHSKIKRGVGKTRFETYQPLEDCFQKHCVDDIKMDAATLLIKNVYASAHSLAKKKLSFSSFQKMADYHRRRANACLIALRLVASLTPTDPRNIELQFFADILNNINLSLRFFAEIFSRAEKSFYHKMFVKYAKAFYFGFKAGDNDRTLGIVEFLRKLVDTFESDALLKQALQEKIDDARDDSGGALKTALIDLGKIFNVFANRREWFEIDEGELPSYQYNELDIVRSFFDVTYAFGHLCWTLGGEKFCKASALDSWRTKPMSLGDGSGRAAKKRAIHDIELQLKNDVFARPPMPENDARNQKRATKRSIRDKARKIADTSGVAKIGNGGVDVAPISSASENSFTSILVDVLFKGNSTDLVAQLSTPNAVHDIYIDDFITALATGDQLLNDSLPKVKTLDACGIFIDEFFSHLYTDLLYGLGLKLEGMPWYQFTSNQLVTLNRYLDSYAKVFAQVNKIVSAEDNPISDALVSNFPAGLDIHSVHIQEIDRDMDVESLAVLFKKGHHFESRIGTLFLHAGKKSLFDQIKKNCAEICKKLCVAPAPSVGDSVGSFCGGTVNDSDGSGEEEEEENVYPVQNFSRSNSDREGRGKGASLLLQNGEDAQSDQSSVSLFVSKFGRRDSVLDTTDTLGPPQSPDELFALQEKIYSMEAELNRLKLLYTQALRRHAASGGAAPQPILGFGLHAADSMGIMDRNTAGTVSLANSVNSTAVDESGTYDASDSDNADEDDRSHTLS